MSEVPSAAVKKSLSPLVKSMLVDSGAALSAGHSFFRFLRLAYPTHFHFPTFSPPAQHAQFTKQRERKTSYGFREDSLSPLTGLQVEWVWAETRPEAARATAVAERNLENMAAGKAVPKGVEIYRVRRDGMGKIIFFSRLLSREGWGGRDDGEYA